jgi:hypothetical protein
MGAKSLRTKSEDRSQARLYFQKAKDNYNAMMSAFDQKNFNAVGTLAVQTVISSADAVCVFEKGMRSVSQNHGDVCDLVMQTRLPDVKERCNALKRVIAKKNAIQYEGRNVSAKEAEDLVKWTERFFLWVSSVLEC